MRQGVDRRQVDWRAGTCLWEKSECDLLVRIGGEFFEQSMLLVVGQGWAFGQVEDEGDAGVEFVDVLAAGA